MWRTNHTEVIHTVAEQSKSFLKMQSLFTLSSSLTSSYIAPTRAKNGTQSGHQDEENSRAMTGVEGRGLSREEWAFRSIVPGGKRLIGSARWAFLLAATNERAEFTFEKTKRYLSGGCFRVAVVLKTLFFCFFFSQWCGVID